MSKNINSVSATMTDDSYAKSIELPADQLFQDMKNAKRFAIDIGGSLAKLAYYSTVVKRRSLILEHPKGSDSSTIYSVGEEDSVQEQLHFIKFETRYIETCVEFIKDNLIGTEQFMQDKVIKVTGGGAHKYKDLFINKLGVQVDKEDEMECLIKGCNFLLKNIADEAFVYQRKANPEYKFQAKADNVYPYLLVNVGSGVSILKVESEQSYERIGGTSMGGGTFWGLGSILTKAKGFDELLALAEQGDHRSVDMLVKDIYGGSYTLLGLPADVIASSFGKAARCSKDKDSDVKFRDADIAKSLLIAISNDIGQLATLHAKLHNLKKIYFGGYFIRGHPVTMHTISYAVNYWSKEEVQALFLRHEGYLGAIGAFLKTVEEQDVERYSWGTHGAHMTWGENYAGSSGLQSPKPSHLDASPTSASANATAAAAAASGHHPNMASRGRSSTFDMLELDRFAKPLVSCPLLLDPASYHPDTDDLTQDATARDYWLHCFQDAIDKFVEKAVNSQPSKTDAEERARRFKNKYVQRLQELRQNPCAYGSLTVRSLLDTREHCMEEFHFADPYSQQKHDENEVALQLLPAHLASLDALEWEPRQLLLAEGMLAGNVFDWGAKEIASMLEKSPTFGFSDARSRLQPRPWLFDDFEAWLARLKSGKPHRCVVIFVDNSGLDIVLGIFPFAREMLKRGSKVLLCANSRPALNDVTYHELSVLTKRVARMCEHVHTGLTSGRLLVMESGQGSPCLDLRAIDYDLADKMKEMGADLILLEGMGRAVHTNFHASFSCEALKVAVLKNKWLATRHGGDMFSIMFKYEPARKVVTASKRR